MMLVKRLSQGALLTGTKLALGLVRIKILALVLGAAGIGVLSLAFQLQVAVTGIVALGLALGIINLGRPAMAAGDVVEAGGVAGTALAMIAAVAGIAALVALIALPSLRHAIFGTHLTAPLWPIVVAGILGALVTGFLEALLFLADRFDLYVRASIMAAVADAAAIGGGAWAFGIDGAVYGALAGSVLGLAAYLATAAETKPIASVLHNLRFDRRHVRPLLGFSVMMMSTGTVSAVVLMAARANVVAHAGAVANGLLQVPVALAGYLMPAITSGLHGHLIPQVAASGDTPASRREFTRAFMAVAALGFVACLGVIVAAPVLVPLIYSSEFLPAVEMLRPYFIGEAMFVVANIYGVYLMGISAKRDYVVGVGVYNLLLLGGVMLKAAAWGAWAYVAAHVVAASAVGGLAFIVALRRGHLARSR